MEEGFEPAHPGCNCGRRKRVSRIPLLTPDLIIAARDRAREPELPAETERHANETPVNSTLARYDLIVIGSGELGPDFERIAAEFARHEHRVFLVGARSGSQARPLAPTIHLVPLVDSPHPESSSLIDTLTDLRQREFIEAAVVILASDTSADDARQMREQWGWRIAVPADPESPLVDIADTLIDNGNLPSSATGRSIVELNMHQSWPARWAALDHAFRSSWPRASIVVLTHDNLAFSRMCIASILENTEYPNYELLIIDNASTDGVREEAERLARDVPTIRTILNDTNLGFGPGNNQGMRNATGDIIVLLNNDTMVPRGWLTRLAHHLRDPALGLIGPATNRACNEAQVELPYQTYAEYQKAARTQGLRFAGVRTPIRMPMMFCTAFRRDVMDTVGFLDERYEVGMFEDEDYAIRVRAAGYEVAWTPEVYVHHAYHASIGKLLPTGEYMRLVQQNRQRFEEKWGICWERHRPLPTPA
jgi:GT2 family glycosyltransferase